MSFDAFATNELINATKSGDVERMRAALKAGGDPDAVSACEPLICFAAGATACSDEVLDVLLAAGADPNKPDEWGTPALAYAVAKRKWPRTDALVKAGADVNCQHEKGISKTVLYNAVMLDLDKGEATHTACVLSLKPDLGVRMFTDDMLRTHTVAEHLERLRELEPAKDNAIQALLNMIARHAERYPPQDNAKAQAEALARRALVTRLHEGAKASRNRYKFGK